MKAASVMLHPAAQLQHQAQRCHADWLLSCWLQSCWLLHGCWLLLLLLVVWEYRTVTTLPTYLRYPHTQLPVCAAAAAAAAAEPT